MHPRPQRKHVIGLGLVLAAVCIAAAPYAHSQDAPPGHPAVLTLGRGDDPEIRKTLKEYEVAVLDVAEVARRVRETGRLSLRTAERQFDLTLSPNDLRAPGYRAEETGSGGARRALDPGPLQTYRGSLDGDEGAVVRFNISEERFEGAIFAGSESYFIEPSANFSVASGTAGYVFYKGSAVSSQRALACEVTLDGRAAAAYEETAMSSGFGGAAPPFMAELATEADYSFVTKAGGSVQALNEILGVMNMVQGIYEREVGITLLITYQHAWATPDPYTSPGEIDTLNQFKDYWNANFSNVQRDLSHMWSDKAGFGGLAYFGVVCKSPHLAYGQNGRYLGGLGAAYTAHEIGHQFGASHAEGSNGTCGGTIMNGSNGTPSQLTFCQYSRNEITGYASANSACLTQVPSGCGSVALSKSFEAVGKDGGSGSLAVTAQQGCAWSATSDSSWLTVTSGAAGDRPGVVGYAVAPNTGVARTGKINVNAQSLTVTQEGATLSCAALPSEVGFWRAEGNGDDNAGANRATVVGDVAYTAGKHGQAFSFGGTSGYVLAGGNGVPAGGSDRTVQFWMKLSQAGLDRCSTLVQHGDFWLFTCGGTIYFPNGGALGASLTQPTDWHHVAVTYEAGVATLYVDGRAARSGPVPINTTSGQNLLMGSSGLNGLLDEVAVYRRALSPAEVHSVYAAGAAGVCGASNAINNSHFFVRQQYVDFFGREPDADGLNFWVNNIESCGADQSCRERKRIDTSAAFFLSIEFQGSGYLVYRAHKAAFGSIQGSPSPVLMGQFLADAGQVGQGVIVGQQGWEQRMEQNRAAYFSVLVGRPAFLAQYPESMTAAQFVDKLNQNADWALSQAERDDLVGRLGAGQLTRAQVLRAVAEDRTLYDAEYRRAFVYMQYVGYMRRDPDQGGFDFWLGKLNNHGGDYVAAEMVKSFLVSSEYRGRFR